PLVRRYTTLFRAPAGSGSPGGGDDHARGPGTVPAGGPRQGSAGEDPGRWPDPSKDHGAGARGQRRRAREDRSRRRRRRAAGDLSAMANPIPNLFRIPELKQKILFTLLALLIY